MQFRAKLKRGTTIYRNWTGRRQKRGKISGVPFILSGKDFVSEEDPLSTDAVAAIKDHPMVDLIITGLSTGWTTEHDPPEDPEPDTAREPVMREPWKPTAKPVPMKRR